MAEMTPEEKFNQQVWEVLQDIQEEILATVAGKPVKYRIPNIVGAGIIWPERRRKILYKIEEKAAFKIQKNEQGVRIGTGDIFYLIINQLKFKEVYEEYKNLNKSKVDSAIQEEINNLSLKAKERILEVANKIKTLVELNPQGLPFEFSPAMYVGTDTYDERSIVLKLQGWGFLESEINDFDAGYLLINTSLERICEAISLIQEEFTKKSLGKQNSIKNDSITKKYNVDLDNNIITWNGTSKKWKSNRVKKTIQPLKMAEYLFNNYLTPNIEGSVNSGEVYEHAYDKYLNQTSKKKQLKSLQNTYDYLRKKLKTMFPDSSPKPEDVFQWRNQTIYISLKTA